MESVPQIGSIYGMFHVTRVSETIARASSRGIRSVNSQQPQVLIGLEHRSNSLTIRVGRAVQLAALPSDRLCEPRFRHGNRVAYRNTTMLNGAMVTVARPGIATRDSCVL